MALKAVSSSSVRSRRSSSSAAASAVVNRKASPASGGGGGGRLASRCRASEPESEGAMADIGLGDLEGVMAAAGGGSAVPAFLADAPAEVKDALEFLGRDNVTISDKVLVERYGETFYEATGFTETAEVINGRLAMLGFMAYMGAVFTGDFLTQLAEHPLFVTLLVATVSGASLVPIVKPEGYMPASVKEPLDKALGALPVDAVFTPVSERINGRAAMVGVAAVLGLAVLF